MFTQGDRNAALLLLEQAMIELERVLGPNHPETVKTTNNLAVAFGMVGDFNRAVELHERALRAIVEICGKEHPDVQAIANNLEHARLAKARG